MNKFEISLLISGTLISWFFAFKLGQMSQGLKKQKVILAQLMDQQDLIMKQLLSLSNKQ